MWYGGVICCRSQFLEQIASHNVHSLIRALSRKNGGYQQFQGISEVQLAMGVRVKPAQLLDRFGSVFFKLLTLFEPHHRSEAFNPISRKMLTKYLHWSSV